MEPAVLETVAEQALSPFAAYAPVLPEIVLAIGAMALLMFGVFRGERSAETVSGLCIGLLAVAALLVLGQGSETQLAFGDAFIVDPFARFLKVLCLIGSAVAILMSLTYLREANILRFEFPILIVLATTGMMMMISANGLIALYLGLELQSLSLYVIAAFRRDSLRSSEAA